MHSVRLDDDAVVHAYKHLSTRRYCHLAEDGRAFFTHLRVTTVR
jgi:hypothetical protein